MKTATQEFAGLEDLYARHRPSYPLIALHTLVDYASRRGLGAGPVLDMGCGTGISTRQLRRVLPSEIHLVGVEPGEAMLRKAQSEPVAGIDFRAGDAEHLPAEAMSLGLVTAMQALQWFDRPAFYREALRALRASGVLAIVQNNRRHQTSEFLKRYEELLERHNPAYRRDYRAFDVADELAKAGFVEVCRWTSDWPRAMTPDEFFGMARSSTKFDQVRRALGDTAAEQALRELLAAFTRDGAVRVDYETEVVMGMKVRDEEL